MIPTATLGFPRRTRTFQAIVETFQAGNLHEEALEKAALNVRLDNWRLALTHGVTYIASNDFSWMDPVRDTMVMLGALPPRLALAGRPLTVKAQIALVENSVQPELLAEQRFAFTHKKVLYEFLEGRDHGIVTRPKVLGPVSFLAAAGGMAALPHIGRLLSTYVELLTSLAQKGCQWVQIDEPCLDAATDPVLVQVLFQAYARLGEDTTGLRLMLVPGAGDLGTNLLAALELPVEGVHLDLTSGAATLARALEFYPARKTLSLGLPEADDKALDALLRPAWDRTEVRIQLAPSRAPQRFLTEPEAAALLGRIGRVQARAHRESPRSGHQQAHESAI